MANIHDYLRWRGDLAFDERAFNDCDNLILSALIYLDFTGNVRSEDAVGLICRMSDEMPGFSFLGNYSEM